jgi:hypothetical protein
MNIPQTETEWEEFICKADSKRIKDAIDHEDEFESELTKQRDALWARRAALRRMYDDLTGGKYLFLKGTPVITDFGAAARAGTYYKSAAYNKDGKIQACVGGTFRVQVGITSQGDLLGILAEGISKDLCEELLVKWMRSKATTIPEFVGELAGSTPQE